MLNVWLVLIQAGFKRGGEKLSMFHFGTFSIRRGERWHRMKLMNVAAASGVEHGALMGIKTRIEASFPVFMLISLVDG